VELDCVKPVTFRLGWDRLLVNPIAIGSPITVITIGISEVDAANALALENHLESCKGCAAAYSEILHLKELIKRDGVRFRAPAPLRERVFAAIAAAAVAVRLIKSRRGNAVGDEVSLFSIKRCFDVTITIDAGYRKEIRGQ